MLLPQRELPGLLHGGWEWQLPVVKNPLVGLILKRNTPHLQLTPEDTDTRVGLWPRGHAPAGTTWKQPCEQVAKRAFSLLMESISCLEGTPESLTPHALPLEQWGFRASEK